MCISQVSIPNSPITPTIRSVSRLARSASNSVTSARPTRSSLSHAVRPPGRPSRCGAYGAAHSPNPYNGARPTSRLTTSSRIAVAGNSLNRRSGAGNHRSSNASSPMRSRKWLISGNDPNRRLTRPNGPPFGVSIPTSAPWLSFRISYGRTADEAADTPSRKED